MPEQTEREFFNAGLYCGEHGYASRSTCDLSRDVFNKGCGARNWRVMRNGLLMPHERILICQDCGAVYPVEMPEWRKAA